MANIFNLTNDIKEVARKAFDDLIDQLSKPCQLYYPPIMEPCNNCKYDPIGKKSSNIYLNGGPAPFPLGGICPVCDGAGFRAKEVFDTVNFLINEDLKTFDRTLYNIANLPDGVIQTKGYMTDLPNVLRCNYMIKDINVEPYIKYKYKLFGEPLSPGNIIQGRYFIALWQRSS